MKRHFRAALLLIIPLCLSAAVLFRDSIIGFIDRESGCPLWLFTGIYCPGCGNTRSLYCLLHLRPIAALRNNPAMPFMLLCLLLWYGELAAETAGRRVKLLPRRQLTWVIIMGIFAAFYILRNFVPFLEPLTMRMEINL